MRADVFIARHADVDAGVRRPQQRFGGRRETQIAPCRCVDVKAGVAPADGHMRCRARIAGERLWRELGSPIDLFVLHRQDQIGVDGAGNQQDFHAATGLLKIVIHRDQADQHDEAVQQQQQADDLCEALCPSPRKSPAAAADAWRRLCHGIGFSKSGGGASREK